MKLLIGFDCPKCNNMMSFSDKSEIPPKLYCDQCGTLMEYLWTEGDDAESKDIFFRDPDLLARYPDGVPAPKSSTASKVTIECPYCHSTDTRKIGYFDRGLSVALLGLESTKIGKQWHCNHCGSNF